MCNKIKSIDEFTKNKRTPDNLAWQCRECLGENHKKHRHKYKERRNLYVRERYHNNPRAKLDILWSNSIVEALKTTQTPKNGRRWESILGYSLSELMTHIESLFEPEMKWDNHGEWHIDHIIPKALFEYHTENDDEFKQCWCLANLQPLWAPDNLKKNRYI